MLSAQVNISLGLRNNVNTTLELLVTSPVLLQDSAKFHCYKQQLLWLTGVSKVATYLVTIGLLLCLKFLYGCHFLNKTQPSTSKLSDNPVVKLKNCKILLCGRKVKKCTVHSCIHFFCCFFTCIDHKLGCHIYSFTMGNELLRLGTKE